MKKGIIKMKLKLISDFWDYYDHWFDIDGQPFYRKSRSGMDRIEMFEFLVEHKIPTVPNGYLNDMMKKYELNQEIVVYEDLDAHRAEGKIKMTIKDALKKYGNVYCSLYIPDNPGLSTRHLRIGDKNCCLIYQSKDWRSNYSDVEIKVMGVWEGSNYETNIEYPLYAIDYVKDNNKGLLAVDFNIAPQIKCTGIEDIIPAKEIVEQIKNKLERINSKNE
jgi:hypothetical protein